MQIYMSLLTLVYCGTTEGEADTVGEATASHDGYCHRRLITLRDILKTYSEMVIQHIWYTSVVSLMQSRQRLKLESFVPACNLPMLASLRQVPTMGEPICIQTELGPNTCFNHTLTNIVNIN